MAQRTCSIEGCPDLAHARGWCSRHYGLWRHRGSVDAEPIRIRGRVCAVPDCGERANAKDLCPAHYLRAKRSGGDPGEVITRPDVRNCWWCDAEYTARDARQLYCSTDCAAFVRSLWNLGRYGITREDYRAAWREQRGVCASCKRPERSTRNRLLCVDHDHVTGHFRGLLCSHCNRAIGLLQDDPKVIASALKYVKSGRQPRLFTT